MNTPPNQEDEKTESDLAHDLRTSLSIIRVNAEVSLLDPKIDKAQKKKLESNIKEVDRIVLLLGKLLKRISLS